jgi:hypothetical protein
MIIIEKGDKIETMEHLVKEVELNKVEEQKKNFLEAQKKIK